LPENASFRFIEAVEYLTDQAVDLVFVGLHGGAGEDGTVQGLLKLAQLPYTGSGPAACAVAMNKIFSKHIFENVGVPTATWRKFVAGQDEWEILKPEVIAAFGFPLVIKPSDQGSTVGLTIVQAAGELDAALQKARRYSSEILFEPYIPGHEMTVAILGDQPLPVIEIQPKHGIYDYECKYQSGMTEYVVPAKIPEDLSRRLQEAALLAHQSLGCRHYSRVDFRVDERGNLFCLEVNTLPGMTKTSLVPKAAKAVGLSFPRLIQKIVELSVAGKS
jgi:D-alanine-D-alanine ligase